MREVPNLRAAALDLSALLTPPDPSFSRPYKQAQDRNDPPTRDTFLDRITEDAAAAWERVAARAKRRQNHGKAQ